MSREYILSFMKWIQQDKSQHIEAVWSIYPPVNWAIIGSDNGLAPVRCQAIIWTNAGLLSIGAWGTNFSEIVNEIQTFSFKKLHLKVYPVKWQPFCLGLNMLTWWINGTSNNGSWQLNVIWHNGWETPNYATWQPTVEYLLKLVTMVEF